MEKLVYLQQALKGGPARSTIEGLSRSGDNYDEAVRHLKAKYDRPRQIHQAHVKIILDAPPIKDGTGREIRKLHDTVLQHLRALKSMGYDPSGPFITSALELKLIKIPCLSGRGIARKVLMSHIIKSSLIFLISVLRH